MSRTPPPERDRLATALALVVSVVAAVGALHRLGGGLLAAPPVTSGEALRAWITSRDAVTIALALGRLLALAVGYQFLAASLLGLLGRGLRAPVLSRLARSISLPPFRPLMGRVAGLALAGTTLTAPATASADPIDPPAAVVRPADASPPIPPTDSTPTTVAVAGTATMWLADGAPVAPLDTPGVATMEQTEVVAGTDRARDHVVQPGDHLWSIAERSLGELVGRPVTDAEVTPHWLALVAANPQLADPDVLFPGQVVTVPAPAGPGVR